MKAIETNNFFATAGAFNKSESPVEARGLKSDKNETIASAGIFSASSNNQKPPDSTTTTTTTTEQTLPPLKPSPTAPQSDKINYGENFFLTHFN